MILVDGIARHVTPLRHKSWSHMVSTVNAAELHEMAERIGLKYSWFQTGSFDHYDITPPKRALAIQLGAIATNSRCLLFGNYDYKIRRPGAFIAQMYRDELAAIGVVL